MTMKQIREKIWDYDFALTLQVMYVLHNNYCWKNRILVFPSQMTLWFTDNIIKTFYWIEQRGNR